MDNKNIAYYSVLVLYKGPQYKLFIINFLQYIDRVRTRLSQLPVTLYGPDIYIRIEGHPSSKLTNTLLEYIHGISLGPMRLIFVELSCLQAKIANLHVEIDPMTSKNRSRSSIFELNQDSPEIHPWYKFGPNVINIC